MKAGIGICSKSKKVLCAGLGVFALGLVASAAPQQISRPIGGNEKAGMIKEGPIGPAVIWLDEATRARGGAASGRSAEALIFHQPNDCGRGFFEKTYDDGPLWFGRMIFGNGWAPGNSISSYELKIFHSSSDDINHGPADYAVELWDGDPLSAFETVCATGGVSAPIPGTAGIVADVPYDTVVQARVELPAKIAYGCDRVWMVMQSLNGCRAAWRLSGENVDGGCFNEAFGPDIGFANGQGVLTGCESTSFQGGACLTPTGRDAGFCCGSIAGPGTCSGSGADCNYVSDCPAGETCDGRESCDHGQLNAAGDDYLDPCSSGGLAVSTFCGDGLVDLFFGGIDAPDSEEGYVGSIFAATETTMFMVPVSVDAIPDNYDPGNAPADLVSLGDDEVVLDRGDHNVWLEIMIGNWDPSGSGNLLNGYQPALDMAASVVSGLQGTLNRYTGGAACGECDDDSSACFSHDDCTAGTCSGSGDPCHIALLDCVSGETCDGAVSCAEGATGDADCAAALGEGSLCGPPGYDLGLGTCSWTYTDNTDPRWALQEAGATLAGLDLCCIDARPSYAVVFGPVEAPVPFPAEGMYAATLALHVPADAKGTFTIGLKPFPRSVLNGEGPPIPLLGTISGFITVQTGRCCITFPSGGTACLDGNQTAGSCAQQAGATVFTANEVCPAKGGPPCECDPNVPGTYDDGDACTDDACIDFAPTSTPKVCDDGLVCTDDACDPDDMTGVGCFATPVDVDDGLVCTVDACTEATGIKHRPVNVSDGDACTFDYCVEPSGDIFHDDLSSVPNAYPCPTGDPVADGCPGAIGDPPVSTTCTDGFCHCIQCFSGVTCFTPVCSTPDAPVPDRVPSGSGTLVTSAKNRFISFGGAFDVCAPLQAARVTFVSLPRPFDLWDGHQLWVTSPVEVNERATAIPPVEGSPSFSAATLRCSGPAFVRYGCMGTVHVFHEGIVPGGIYRIEFLSEFCSPELPGDFSPPLEIINSDLGDVVGVSAATPPSAPDGFIDVIDFLALLRRFSSIPGSIIKARADLEPGCLDLTINISDILASVTGFQGLPYQFAPTASDPCASTCFNPLP